MRFRSHLITAAITLIIGTAGQAAHINTSVPLNNWTGAFQEGAGVSTSGGFANDGLLFNVLWSITELNATTLRYSYTFTGYGQDISNIVLQLTPSCVTGGSCAFNVNGAGGQQEVRTYSDDMPLGASIYGIKFEGLGGNQVGSTTISFDSTRIPMFGSFNAKSGGGTAFNTGLSGNAGDFYIPVPNTLNFNGGDDGGVGPSEIPEPASMYLLGFGVVGIGFVRLHRERSLRRSRTVVP